MGKKMSSWKQDRMHNLILEEMKIGCKCCDAVIPCSVNANKLSSDELAFYLLEKLSICATKNETN